MDTMAHGWFLVGAIIATVVLALSAMACAFSGATRHRGGSWIAAAFVLNALSAVAGLVALASLILNVIRYAKGGA